MGAPVRMKVDDTRTRIIEAADTLFRRLGYAKTAVADIAAELRMSPANVYRFFPSKAAIVDAICGRCLAELEAKAYAVARGSEPASARLERLVLEVMAYHKDNLLTEQRVHDIVLIAMEQNWAAIVAHKEVVRSMFEHILRDGVKAGEFEPIDPVATSRIYLRSLVAFCHPELLAQGLREGHDLEAEARESLSFLLRAITPRS